ncbi:MULTISPECIES: ornithine carbamoyltransferase [unclassified Embleya]|uniref:ornithine carbamoyltransferase n=1 Tax=unclassified Embleya TaxID=2699296 RepID=UPI0033CB5D1C
MTNVHTSTSPSEPAGRDATPKDLLRVADLEPTALVDILELARRMKQDPLGWQDTLRGGAVGCVFEKPSTRTRVSLAVAAHRLGMTAVLLSREEMQLGHGESVADTARVLSSYLDAVTVRTHGHDVVEELADHASIPVVNALSNTHHPCQSLADLLALTEHFGSLRGLTAAFVGDARGNTCNSFTEACAATGMHLNIAHPPGYDPDPDVLARARATMRTTGGSVNVVIEPAEAVRGARAVYAEVWVPMDRKNESALRARVFASYRVDRELLAHADAEATVLHCLPAVRGEEITSDVLDGPRCLAWRQAANRLPTSQAVLHTLVTGSRARG